MDSGNEINAITPIYASKLGLPAHPIDVGAQKNRWIHPRDFSHGFKKLSGRRSGQKSLVISRNFLIRQYQCGGSLKYAFFHIQQYKRPVCRKRIYLEVLYYYQSSLTIKWVELINKKKFAKTILEENFETFCNNVTLGAGAESSQSGIHVTTIIQTSPWSAWPPPQRLIQPGSHLEPRFLLILCTRPPIRLLTVYAVGRYFRLWKLFVLRSLVKEMGLSFLERHWMAWSLSGRLDATEFAPPLCRHQPRLMTRAHLLIGTGQGCWLDDKGAPPQVIG